MPSPAMPRSRALVPFIVLLACAAIHGCAQLIGADQDHELFPLADGESGATVPGELDLDGGGAADVIAPSCTAGEKRCNGTCVAMTAENGCSSSTTCEPCSLSNAATVGCKFGLCAATTCKPGFGACGDPKDGCSSDLSSVNTCGSCLMACNADAGQVCSPLGCGADCGALTNCGGSCVDRMTSAAHCGTCGKKCATAANGDPECKAGACGIVCRQGYAHCDGNPVGPCVALKTFYRDADGDGVGVAGTTKVACDLAAAGAGWAPIAGDCHDGNAAVKPGAAASSVPYQTLGGATSYDFDCDGVEVEQFQKYLGCNAGAGCTGSGYGLAYSNRPGDVNDYCGGPVKACSATEPEAYPSVFENGCYVFTPATIKGSCK